MASVALSGTCTLLLCLFICRMEICAAVCSVTWTDFVFDGVGGYFLPFAGSCITSRHLIMYGEITDGVFDEFRLYIDINDRQEGVTFYGNVSYQRKASAIIDFEESYVGDFYPVAWCQNGPGDSGPCLVKNVTVTFVDCIPCNRGVRRYGECSNDTPAVDTVCIVDCPPDYGSVMTSDGECELCPRGHYKGYYKMDSSECFPCPKGTYNDEFGASECKNCPKGTFGENDAETRAICSGLCPAGTYNDINGSIACKPCPSPELSIASGRVSLGMSTLEECGSFATSGFWYTVGQGSIAGDSTWSTTLSEGIRTVQANATFRDFVALREDVSLTMSIETSMETRSNEGWSTEVASHSTGLTTAARYMNDFAKTSIFSGNFSSYVVSDGAANALSAAVLPSVVNDSFLLCKLECKPLLPFLAAYGWRWIHLVYDNDTDDLILAVETCETDCMYSPDEAPMCAPGRCADLDCTSCFPGSFYDPIVDGIASKAGLKTKGESGMPIGESVMAEGESGMSTGAIVGIIGGSLVGLGLATWLFVSLRRKSAESTAGAEQNVIMASAVPAEILPPVVESTVFISGEEILVTECTNVTEDTGPSYKDQARSYKMSDSDRNRLQRPVTERTNTMEGTVPTYKDQARSSEASNSERNRIQRPVSEQTYAMEDTGPTYKDQARSPKASDC
jgi:Tyrosine-protein kinase ephrin type A/B receptor-like